jgi:hypothetical protein
MTKSWVLRAVSLSVMVALLFVGRSALASSFSIKTTEVTEDHGQWHIKVRIDLSRAPSMMHTPMRFTFSKEVVDERAIMSKGAEPVHHRNVLETPQKTIVGMDVDFADPSGQVFKSTYFEFDVARKDGYFEAGEYLVTLAGQDGDIGGTQKLTLKGDNPPVYRGAMDFASDSKSSKKKGVQMQSVNSGIDAGSQEVAQNDTPAAAGPSGPVDDTGGKATPMISQDAYKSHPEDEAVQGHPSGCGCVLAGANESAASGRALGAGAMALLAMGVLARRRR